MRGAAQLLDLPQLLAYALNGRRLPVARTLGERGTFQVLAGIVGERELQRRVEATAAVLRGGYRTQRVARRVEALLLACRLVLQRAQPLRSLAGLLLGAVVLLGGDLRLLVQLVDLGLHLCRRQLGLGVPRPVEGGGRRRTREGDRGGGAGLASAERALPGLAVCCHEGATSFRTAAGAGTRRSAVTRPAAAHTGGAGRRRTFSAVVSGCRPWPGRRWGAEHLVEDAKPEREGLVTPCTEVAPLDRPATASDRNSGPESPTSHGVMTDGGNPGQPGVRRC